MSSKRDAHDALLELHTLLEAKGKVARQDQNMERKEVPCRHEERVRVVPTGPRDNGEFWYVCTRCGDVQ